MITCTADGHVRTVMIPPRQRLDTPWPMIRIALKCTPLAVGWYPEGRLVAVLTQREAPFRPWVPEESQGDAHASYAYATAEGGARARNKLLLSEVKGGGGGGWEGVGVSVVFVWCGEVYVFDCMITRCNC